MSLWGVKLVKLKELCTELLASLRLKSSLQPGSWLSFS